MPRSPTKVIAWTPNLALTLLICVAKVCGSWVLPGNTSIETGWPSSSQSKPMTIWRLPFLPSRQFPCTCGAQGLCDPQASGDVVHGPHGPKRHPLLQGDRVLDGPKVLQILLVAQRQTQRFDLRGGTMTDIGNRAVEDLAVG